ncbi:hypothetical protein Efla_003860 [Eimeria flavescens]
MARAMAAGLVRAGVCSPAEINVTERTKGGLLFITVKPAGAVGVLEEVGSSLGGVGLVVSACVGVPLEALSKAVSSVPVARIMPNVLCAIGEGSTGYCISPCKEATEGMLRRALEAFGPVHAIPESLFDVYSAISGSSPAFVLTFIEALIDGGVRCGMPRDLATLAALQSVRGTAMLAQMEAQHPAILRDRITSPGGTTIAGLLALERRAFRASVGEAIEAACERSKEIQSSEAKSSG